MYKPRSLRKTRDTQLIAIAGLVSGIILLGQLNLQEVLRWDRLQHSILSMVLFFVFHTLFKGQKNQLTLSFAATLLIGVGKEFMDHQAQGFDMVANVFGVGVGLILAIIALGLSARVLSSRP